MINQQKYMRMKLLKDSRNGREPTKRLQGI